MYSLESQDRYVDVVHLVLVVTLLDVGAHDSEILYDVLLSVYIVLILNE